MATFRQVLLLTGEDGRACFREQDIALAHGSPAAQLSELLTARALQLRESPVGFRSAVHVSTEPQWVFILAGAMEIGLPAGGSRVFQAGEHFFSADTLPEGATFDAQVHGHWSAQVGDQPLVTAFIKV